MKLYDYLTDKSPIGDRTVVIRDYRFKDVSIDYSIPFCGSGVKHRMMLYISKYIDIIDMTDSCVVTNISDVIEASMDERMYAKLHLPMDIDQIMSNINIIFSPQSNDFWMVQFISGFVAIDNTTDK